MSRMFRCFRSIPLWIVHNQILETFLSEYSGLFHAVGANLRDPSLVAPWSPPIGISNMFNALPLR